MKRHLIRSIYLVFAGVVPFSFGCGQDNQSSAKIQGTVPQDTATPTDRRGTTVSTSSDKSSGYPTPGSKVGGGNSAGANRRK